MANEPNYKKYTLEELKEALNSIDKSTYNARAELIQKEIENKLDEINKIELKGKEQINKKGDVNRSILKYINIVAQKFVKYSFLLHIFSFVLGVSLLSSSLFGFSLAFSKLGYSIEFYILGLFQLTSTIRYFIITIMAYLPIVGLIMSPIIYLFNKKISNILLLLFWSILTIGLKIVIFKWWPTLTFDIEFGFDFIVNEKYELGLKINLIAAYFLLWSSFLIPQFRNEIFKELKIEK